MAEQRQTHYQQQPPTNAIKGMLPDGAPSKSQVLAVVILLPVGGTLLLLSGLTLTGTLIGLAVATPLFVLFSPVLVPAALVIGLAIAGFLTSGAFGGEREYGNNWSMQNGAFSTRRVRWSKRPRRRARRSRVRPRKLEGTRTGMPRKEGRLKMMRFLRPSGLLGLGF